MSAPSVRGSGEVGLHVEDHGGDRPPLLLLHGLHADIRSWDPVVPLLRDRFRLVALDLPGHGRSPSSSEVTFDSVVADLASIVADLRLGTSRIWGHSMGGWIGLRFAAVHDCAAVLCEDSGWGAPEGAITDDVLERVMANEDIGSVLHRRLNVGVLETARDLPRVLTACSCPIQLIFAPSSESNTGAKRWTTALADHYENVRVEWVDSSEHDLHIEMPETLANLAVSFLNTTPTT